MKYSQNLIDNYEKIYNISKESYTYDGIFNQEQFINACIREAKYRYMDSHLYDYIAIDCCCSCNNWTVGDNRCECGNRRITLDYMITSDDDEVYIYPTAY